MAEAKWIKLAINLSDHRKIKRIRKMPDGDSLVLFWVFLLTRAGESNRSGGLYLTEGLAYSAEDLAADFDFSEEFVEEALSIFEKYGMIQQFENVYFIKNWENYQSTESLTKIREQNRIRQANFRAKQKSLASSNVTDNVSTTPSNAIDKELDKDKEIDSYGELQNVYLTKSELNKLKREFEDYEERIDQLSLYIGSTNRQYKSHYITLLSWARKNTKNRSQTKTESLNYVEVPEEFR